MATTVLSNGTAHTKADNEHLEIFYLVWLDANINESSNAEQKLRSIINQLEKFQDVDECIEYINQKSVRDRLVIIVSAQLGRQLVACIHKFRQVISIYIYCVDKTSNEEWSIQYSKVKGIVNKLDELISRIARDHKTQKKVEEPLPISTFTQKDNAGKTTAQSHGQFVCNQILIDCLLQLKSNEIDKNELIKHFKRQYKGNNIELNNLRDFEKDYSPDKVLHWYTKETFFYRTLNAALRTENIHMIFLFRSYISDIYHQLQRYQSKDPVKVYRSQMITYNELKDLKECIDQYISINSFFSTTTTYEHALSFLRTSSDLERVLFEIDADPKAVITKPFADISIHSAYTREAEVLFMLGSVFRLKSIDRNDNHKVWTIKMRLCSEDEYDSKDVIWRMKKQNIDEEINLRTLGKILWKMGEFDLAKKYFMRSIQELSRNDPLRVNLYEDLSKLASQTGDNDKSLQYLQRSIECKKQNQLSASAIFGKTIKAVVLEQVKWKQFGITIVGGNGNGNQINQLSFPLGIFLTDDKTVYIADWGNDRIVQWKYNSKSGEIVAGGSGNGKRNSQLSYPTDVISGKEKNSYIVCDRGNRRLMQWICQNKCTEQVLISDIDCYGLTMDNKGFVYVSDHENNEVRRWKEGDRNGILVAGGNGEGKHLDQLHCPTYIFVDDNYSVYVSDRDNHRVMKWEKDATEGLIVAGGNGEGDSLSQLCFPEGVIVDHLGRIYVADNGNHRIIRWYEGYEEGSIVVGGNGKGREPNQLNSPTSLSFDVEGNLYVADHNNDRIQKYEVDFY